MKPDPEPGLVDAVFGAVLLVVVIGCFVALWWDLGALMGAAVVESFTVRPP